MPCKWRKDYDEAVEQLERLHKAYGPRFARLNAIQGKAEKMFNAECNQVKRQKDCVRPEGGCRPQVDGTTPLYEAECPACKWMPLIRRVIKLRAKMSGRILEATMRKRHLYWYPPEGWVPEDETGDEPDEHLTWIADEIGKEVV